MYIFFFFFLTFQTDVKPGTSANTNGETPQSTDVPNDIYDFYEKLEKEDEDTDDVQVVSVEINQEKIEVLQKR